MSKKILLTAFHNTSSELLIKNTTNYEMLILPNDKVKDSELLIEAVSSRKYDYVISFGQRPIIKDKVHIETTAAKADGICIDTNFDCEILKDIFEESGIIAKISHNAGSSFCNSLYFNGLKYINENGLKTKMVFIHIPFAKNISCFKNFCVQILCVLEKICFGKHI